MLPKTVVLSTVMQKTLESITLHLIPTMLENTVLHYVWKVVKSEILPKTTLSKITMLEFQVVQ